MNDHQGKKDWFVPELTVLVRSKPEEGVLMQCKVEGKSGEENSEGG